MKLPFLTPLGWAFIFGIGFGFGVCIALQMLIIRGIM
jgi:hypothetical protein